MNKKILLILFNILLFSNLVFADMPLSNNPGIAIKNEQMMLQEMRKEQLLFQKNLRDLLEKHNSAKEKDKAKIFEEIKALISVQADKEIKNNREFLKMQMERIGELDKKIKEIESDKSNYINERAKFFVEQYQHQGQNNMVIRRSVNITVGQ
ncbi:MAG: hypothetical protein LBV16_05930 [Elusimicrobiota bacterium]|nr:hypothetical protein [Elusimicrobiota bacterium]